MVRTPLSVIFGFTERISLTSAGWRTTFRQIDILGFLGNQMFQALLDAAKIAGIPVLRLMNEHTATALAYGIYRSNDFDAEKPCTVAFCLLALNKSRCSLEN